MRRRMKQRIQGPQAALREENRGEKVDIDPAQSKSVQPVELDQFQHVGLRGHGRLRQMLQSTQQLVSVGKREAGDLTEDERMADYPPGLEQGGQSFISNPEVIHPDGRVDEYRHKVSPRRRRTSDR